MEQPEANTKAVTMEPAGTNAQPIGPAESEPQALTEIQDRADGVAALNDEWSALLPPEGVVWANRWADVQNLLTAVETERDTLKEEVAQLRKHRVEQAKGALSSSKATSVDSAELKALHDRLDQARTQVDTEQNQKLKMSEELQQKNADLARLTGERLQLLSERDTAVSELLPLSQERDKLAQAKRRLDELVAEIRDELDKQIEDRNKVFREQADLVQRLTSDLEAARTEAKTSQEAAEEARAGQRAAQDELVSAEQRLSNKVEAFSADRAVFEKKLSLRDEQLARATELHTAAQEQLVSTMERLSADEATAGEIEALRLQNRSLMEKLSNEDEAPRRTSQTTACGSPPEGFVSITELVSEVTTLREKVLAESQEKLRLQMAFEEVEREVRTRYPMLKSQREEVDRLRSVSKQLTVQNEGLLVNVQKLERDRRNAEERAEDAHRLARTLETHTRDMAKQMAILVQEIRQLSGEGLKQERSVGSAGDAAETPSDGAFHNVEELVKQNESLRKLVARLREECETDALQRQAQLREERSRQLEDVKRQIEEKDQQTTALSDMVARLTQERDEAQQLLREQRQAAHTPGSPLTPGVAGAAQHERRRAVRKEFSKFTEALDREMRETRASELKLRETLFVVQGQLDAEHEKRSNLERSLQEAELKLDQRQTKSVVLEKRAAALERSLSKEESSARNVEAQLGQAHRDQQHVEMELKAATARVTTLEKSNTTLLGEKCAHAQVTIDLQARMAQQSEAYIKMKAELERSYGEQARLLKEPLELSEKRRLDLQRTLEEQSKIRAEQQAQASEARDRVEDLESKVAHLEAQLAEQTVLLDDFRTAGAVARPRRSSDVTAEVEAHLRRTDGPREGQPEVRELKKKLRLADVMAQEHQKDTQLWKGLLTTHEASVAKKEEDIANLHKDIAELQARHVDIKAESEKAGEREQLLEARTQKLSADLAELQAVFDRRDAEVVAVQQETERKAREAGSRLESAERETAGARDVVGDWQRRHREATLAHAEDIEQLHEAQKRCAALERKTTELQQQNADLESAAEAVRADHALQVDAVREQLQNTEAQMKSVSERAEARQEQGQSSEFRGAAWVKKLHEVEELRRRELELDRANSEREASVLRAEVTELQARVAKEQKQVSLLAADAQREGRAVAKLGQISALEDENKRLEAEIKTWQGRFSEAQSALVVHRTKAAGVQEARHREAKNDTVKKELEGKAEQWKARHDALAAKLKAVEEKTKEVLFERERLVERSDKLAEDYKKSHLFTDELKDHIDKLTSKIDQMQKDVDEAKGNREMAKERCTSLEREGTTSLAHIRLRDKRIAELEKMLDETHKEAEVKVANDRADLAVSLAMDYQRATEALLVQSEAVEAQGLDSVDVDKRTIAGQPSSTLTRTAVAAPPVLSVGAGANSLAASPQATSALTGAKRKVSVGGLSVAGSANSEVANKVARTAGSDVGSTDDDSLPKSVFAEAPASKAAPPVPAESQVKPLPKKAPAPPKQSTHVPPKQSTTVVASATCVVDLEDATGPS